MKRKFEVGEKIWFISTTGENLTKTVERAKVLAVEDIMPDLTKGFFYKIKPDREDCYDTYTISYWAFENRDDCVKEYLRLLETEIREYQERIETNQMLIRKMKEEESE